jgi:hypothetical protein
MAVSPFDRLRSGRTRIDRQLMGSTASTIITQKPTVASEKIAARRTRDSVRRASDFVQIAISLTTYRGTEVGGAVSTVRLRLAVQPTVRSSAAGMDLSAIVGIPVSVKDLPDIGGDVTTAGSMASL